MSQRAVHRVAAAVRRHGSRQRDLLARDAHLALVRTIDPLRVELVDSPLAMDDEELTLTQSVRHYDVSFGLKVGDTVVVQPVSSGEWVVSSVISDKSTFEGADTKADLATGTIGGTIDGTATVGSIPYRDADGVVVGRIPLIAP